MKAGDFSGAAYDGVLPVLYDQNAPDSTLKTVNSVQAAFYEVLHSQAKVENYFAETLLKSKGK